MSDKTTGWVVVPAYNEEAGIETFVRRLAGELSNLSTTQATDFTILVVNDGSRDRTATVLEKLGTTVNGVTFKSLHFVRNFGHQAALVAGLSAAASARASFVITMDADGEHPVDLLSTLIEKWKAGAPMVHTVRLPDQRIGLVKRLTSSAYYNLVKLISGLEIASGMADFKLWDGLLLRRISSHLANCGSTRTFAVWLAPHAPRVEFHQNFVAGRRSRFTSRKMWSLALSGLVRFSDAPLRLSIVTGMLATATAFGFSLYSVASFFWGNTVPGWTSLVILISVFSSAQIFSIGILGEYMLRIVFRSSLPRYVLGGSEMEQ